MARQARAVATRAHIVLAAAAVFERSGYEGSSLNDIVERAGITKGALYFHFASKDELAHVVAVHHKAVTSDVLETVVATEAPALDKMVMVCHELGRRLAADIVVRAGLRLRLERTRTTRRPEFGWIDRCEQLLRQAVDEGDVDPATDLAVLAHFLVSAYAGIQLVSNVLDERTKLEQHIDGMWELLLPNIVPEHRQASRVPQVRAARWSAAPHCAPATSEP
ncbi:ScbR family autoregulator-binding transcription factor [Rhodococcus sp. HNM0569]|uniref:ScbR family autoregulator-binding transcription factor n=1 Tax=Rhodococcus sp. HNM0569 TaxID=2716340 RepID=UPI00146F7AD1|nr:TetR/AcrR family transcriptional regulator [Rhodococcus sp. HNM0569]